MSLGRRASVAALLLTIVSGCGGDRIVLAAGTTLVDSGGAAALVAAYVAQGGDEIAVVGGSSQEVLTLLAAGEADIGLTHHPELERDFAADHPEMRPIAVFSSRYALAGPGELASQLAGMTVEDAMATLAAGGFTFVSRDDASGTAAREEAVWSAAGIDPTGRPWHVISGAGMGTTLQIADQRAGFVFTDLAALLASGLDLVPVETVAGEVSLDNPYTLWVATDARGIAADFADWVAAHGAGVLADFSTDSWNVAVYGAP